MIRKINYAILSQEGSETMKETLTCILDIAEQLLLSGAEVYRVEESVQRMCLALGAERIDIFIITTSIVATIYDSDGSSFTQTRRVHVSRNDFELTHRLNKLSRWICEEKPSVESIREEFHKAMEHKRYPYQLEYVAYSVIAGSFTLFFGGGLPETLVSLLIGLSVRYIIYHSGKIVPNKIFTKFFSSFIATVMAYAAMKLGVINEIAAVIIGNIMTLIPGVGLTNAFRDLFTGDNISGLLRTVEAALTALAIAAGYIIVALIGGAVL